MKVSIVTAILNSHKVVERQMRHYKGMPLPRDVEVIFVDDGSDPPLNPRAEPNFNFKLIATNDFRAWTQPKARNIGVKDAVGEYIIVTDIDHILSRTLIDTVRSGQWDVVRFRRELGIIDELGQFTQDVEELVRYGVPRERLERRGVRVTPHTNSFGIRRDLYWKLGGVSEKRVGMEVHPHREEQPIKAGYKKLAQDGKITVNADDERPVIYVIPNGRFCGDKDYNPFGLFHDLKRKTR